jgi:hypothetical protein
LLLLQFHGARIAPIFFRNSDHKLRFLRRQIMNGVKKGLAIGGGTVIGLVIGAIVAFVATLVFFVMLNEPSGAEWIVFMFTVPVGGIVGAVAGTVASTLLVVKK